jgi:Xaa-Pro dipeptidase
MDAPANNLLAIRPADIDSRFNWGRHLPALGTMAVDFEERVNYRRLHEYRIGRARSALEASELGALLVFDVNNIRYLASTKIGEWERDKLSCWALLVRGEEPILWDFGSAAVHHKLYCPWLKRDNVRAGLVGLRGTVHPDFGLMERHAREIFGLLKEAGVDRFPVGVDIVEPPLMFQLQQLGLEMVDGHQTMLEAREIKNIDDDSTKRTNAGFYTRRSMGSEAGPPENHSARRAPRRNSPGVYRSSAGRQRENSLGR